MSELEQAALAAAWRDAGQAAWDAERAAWDAEQAAGWAGGPEGDKADLVEAEAMVALFAAQIREVAAWEAWKRGEPHPMARPHGWSNAEMLGRLREAVEAWRQRVLVARDVVGGRARGIAPR